MGVCKMVLIRPKNRWVAELKVPADVQSAVGKKVLREALSEDKAISQLRHNLLVAQWKLKFASYRGDYIDIEEKVNDVVIVDDKSNIMDFVEGWLKQRQVAPKTLDSDRHKVTEISKSIKTIDAINHKNLRVMFEQMAVKGFTHRTVKSYLAAFNDFYKYLRRIDKVNGDLPGNIVARKKLNKDRLPFDLIDIFQLRKEAASDKQLSNLIKLAMYTGCRIEELCSLHCDLVTDEHIEIVNGKTKSSNRIIPIHSKIKRLIRKLKRMSNDGYIMSGLSSNKYGHRSNAIGKRFGRLKRRLFYDNSKVFHSFRKTFATQLEQAGVPEGVAADILGHDKPTMSYGLYSGGSSFQQKKSAVREINYG